MKHSGWTENELDFIRQRAHSLYLQGLHAESAVLLEGVVTLDPSDRYSRYALATVWIALGRSADALAQLDILIARDGDDIEARGCRCEALIHAGDLAAAGAELAQLRTILPAVRTTQLSMKLEAASAGLRLQ